MLDFGKPPDPSRRISCRLGRHGSTKPTVRRLRITIALTAPVSRVAPAPNAASF